MNGGVGSDPQRLGTLPGLPSSQPLVESKASRSACFLLFFSELQNVAESWLGWGRAVWDLNSWTLQHVGGSGGQGCLASKFWGPILGIRETISY